MYLMFAWLLILGMLCIQSSQPYRFPQPTNGNILTFERIGEHGRLGNQLFQIAATMCIAEESERAWSFPESISQTSAGKLFLLSGSKELEHLKIIQVSEPDESVYTSIPLPEHEPGTVVSLHGYFQHREYFENCHASLGQHLKFDPASVKVVERTLPQVLSDNSVAVHVRRGDYTKPGFNHLYVVLDKDYYRRALLEIGSIDSLIIVSDDIDWCKAHFADLADNVVFSPFADELLDFIVLFRSKHTIIANSSFSWWSAFLKGIHGNLEQPPGIVVAPDTWYRTEGPYAHLNRKSLFPNSWKVIPS